MAPLATFAVISSELPSITAPLKPPPNLDDSYDYLKEHLKATPNQVMLTNVGHRKTIT